MGNMKRPAANLAILISGGMLITLFNNCTKIATTSIDPIQKTKAVSDPVIGGGDDVGTPADDGGGQDIGVKYDCSNDRTDDGKKAMLSTASKVTLKVSGCVDDSSDILVNLINKKKIVSAKCVQQLKAATRKKDKRSLISLVAVNKKGVENELVSSKSNDDELYVIYNVNTKATAKSGMCDLNASPLFVLLKEKEHVQPVEFSAPLKGIEFDIFGQRAKHEKFLISWYKNENLYFLVKPNAKGEVNGADELFGNNTKGPDGKYARNGYLALAKFDSDHDGVITVQDDVYRDLRLWNDANLDGVAQSAELFTLSEKKIEVIDLDYDEHYKEVDQWGNRIMYKSVMRTEDQQLHVMFDIWFRALPTHLRDHFPRFEIGPVASMPMR